MNRGVIIALCLLAIVPTVTALEPDSSTFNSLFYGLFYNNESGNSNVTQYFNNSVWNPEYDSSTECNISDLSTGDGVTVANMTNNQLVTDEWSEALLIAAIGDNETLIDGYYNTLQQITYSDYLQAYKASRNGSVIRRENNDSASDATARIGLAWYYAGNNLNFSAANRSKYLQWARNMSIAHVNNETIAYNWSSAVTNTTGSILPMGGWKCANSGIGCSVDMWIGYAPDLIKFMIASYLNTGNETYLNISIDYANAFTTISLQNDSDGDGFGVAPFNFNWGLNGGNLTHEGGGSVNAYHYNINNEQWDDSDAPRFNQFCDVLAWFDEAGADLTTEPLLSTVHYCSQWHNNSVTETGKTTLQYYYNGTGKSAPTTGYYQNGLGYFHKTYYNVSDQVKTLNESINHYSAVTYTYDSTACMGIYRGVRPVKALADYLGYMDADAVYTPASTPAAASGFDPNSIRSFAALNNIVAIMIVFVFLIATIGTIVGGFESGLAFAGIAATICVLLFAALAAL